MYINLIINFCIGNKTTYMGCTYVYHTYIVYICSPRVHYLMNTHNIITYVVVAEMMRQVNVNKRGAAESFHCFSNHL